MAKGDKRNSDKGSFSLRVLNSLPSLITFELKIPAPALNSWCNPISKVFSVSVSSAKRAL